MSETQSTFFERVAKKILKNMQIIGVQRKQNYIHIKKKKITPDKDSNP